MQQQATVQKVTMAQQGPELSELVQGYWRLAEWNMTPQQRLTFLKQHIELGISTVDHADIYGNYQCETLFGEALALEPSLREQIEIVTKCDIKLCSDRFPERKINHYDTSAAHIYQSVNHSLERLGVNEIDVLLIHRPDVLMNADEVAEAFSELHKVGKVKHFGVSNFSPAQFDLLQSRLGKLLVTNQVEINPLNFEWHTMALWINCSVYAFAQWHGHASVAARFSQVKPSKRSVYELCWKRSVLSSAQSRLSR